jgi:hypothetical protein
LFIAQSLENGVGGGAVGGDAARGPEGINFGEEGGDLTPACSFASFAGFADEDDEEIETAPSGADEGMWGGSGELAEGGEELQQEGHRVGFAVRGEAADDAAGETVEGWMSSMVAREEKPQVPPLRYAPVGMTILFVPAKGRVREGAGMVVLLAVGRRQARLWFGLAAGPDSEGRGVLRGGGVPR